MNQPKLWTKDFIMISLTNFFTHVIFYTLMTTIAMYVTQEFHQSQSIAGLAVGIFVIASLLARLIGGKYLDTVGRKRTLIWSLILCVAAIGLHLIAATLTLLILFRFIHGLLHGLITTAAGAIAADIIPDERLGEGTGYYTMSTNIAMAIGPFLGIFISQHAGYQVIILIGTIIAAINFIVTLLIKVPEAAPYEEKVQKSTLFNIRDYIEPKAVPISMVMFTLVLAYSTLISFVSIYAEEIQAADISSFFFIVYAAALVITRPFTGKWFDLFGENKVTYPLIICLAIGFLLLSQAGSGFMLLLSAAFIGVGYGTLQSNYQTIAIQQSPSHRKALATSTFFIFVDLSLGIGPYLLGRLVELMSFRQLYLMMFIWVMVSIWFYYRAHGRKTDAERKRVSYDNL